MRNSRLSLSDISKKGMLLLYPLRDMFGVVLSGIPFRLGEIWVCIAGVFGIVSSKNKIDKKESGVLIILFLNLMVSIIGLIIQEEKIDTSFAMKYLVRNVIYIIFVFGLLVSNNKLTGDEFSKFCKNIVLFEFILLLLIELTGVHFFMNTILTWKDIEKTGQYVVLGGRKFVRFMGSASEAGYLAPLLIMPYIYYLGELLEKKETSHNIEKKMCMMILICAVMTFSTAVYFMFVILTAVYFLKNISQKRYVKYLLYTIIIVPLVLFLLYLIPEVREYLQVSVLNKIQYYLGISTEVQFDWSAADRLQHLQNAWNYFGEGNIVEKIIGHGTGAYSAKAEMSSNLLVKNVEEAYNLYLSSLTDRGFLGFLSVILSGIYLQKLCIKNDNVSQAIYYGLVAQYIHWMLTGNFWLYYFWNEVAFLIMYRRYKLSVVRNEGLK